MGSAGGNFSGEKFPPDPFQKTFKQGKGYNADPGFFRCGSAVQGLVRSTIGDPDLRSPSGFDFGLRPPLRMTREGRGYAVSMRGEPLCNGSPRHCLLTYNAETNESLLQWEKVAAEG